MRIPPGVRSGAEGQWFDKALAVAVGIVLSPVIAVRAALAYGIRRRLFDTHTRLGRGLRPITIRSFAGKVPGRRLAYLTSIVRGEVRFIGPRPLDPDDWEGRARRSPDVTPGLLSTARLRARLGIDYDSEAQVGDQRAYTRRAVSLVVRYAIAEALGGSHLATPKTFEKLGVQITNTTMEEALDWCVNRARQRPAGFLAFVNAACFNERVVNPAYSRALDSADRILPDGVGIKLGARFRRVSVIANVNGTDLFPRLCERAAEQGLALYLLGARPGVAEAVARTMTARYAGLRVAGTQHGYYAETDEPSILENVNASGADILLVAFGVPRQEKWIHTHLPDLQVGLAIGVGGLFDFYSGRIPRAPHWVREVGLEWAWRLLQEPGRMWRRYVVGNPTYLWRAWSDSRRRADSPGAAPTPERLLLDYRDEYPEVDGTGDEAGATPGVPSDPAAAGSGEL